MQFSEGFIHFLRDFVEMFGRFAENLFFNIFLDLPQGLGAILPSILDKVLQCWGQIIQIVIEGWSRADTEDRQRQQVELNRREKIKYESEEIGQGYLDHDVRRERAVRGLESRVFLPLLC